METKIELEVITNQLKYALDELKRKRLDRNLIHDYITDGIEREASLIALIGDIKCNIEQYGYLTNDVVARIDKAINDC